MYNPTESRKTKSMIIKAKDKTHLLSICEFSDKAYRLPELIMYSLVK